STIPWKYGVNCGVTVAAVVAPPVTSDGESERLDTNNSSNPTLSTAFWLFSVAMRGLERTCTTPCDSRKVSSEAKLFVWRAKPNTAPAGLVAAKDPAAAVPPSVV